MNSNAVRVGSYYEHIESGHTVKVIDLDTSIAINPRVRVRNASVGGHETWSVKLFLLSHRLKEQQS